MKKLWHIAMQLLHGGRALSWPLFIRYSLWGSAKRHRRIFLETLFPLFAKLARSDGALTDAEREAIENVMVYELRLKAPDRIIAYRAMRTAAGSTKSFQQYAEQYYVHFRNARGLLENAIFLLIALAASDNLLRSEEKECVAAAARVFGLTEKEVRRIYDDYRRISEQREYYLGQENQDAHTHQNSSAQSPPFDRAKTDLEAAYEILQSKPEDSFDAIRARYRILIKRYHPDVLRRRGIPPKSSSYCTAKFREVQEAFERVEKVHQR